MPARQQVQPLNYVFREFIWRAKSGEQFAIGRAVGRSCPESGLRCVFADALKAGRVADGLLV
jgi:hypothetical protein